ncbi:MULTISPECIES: DUF2850 domain-containing protein [unclassified Agarivorans]|uniref:DUF2850 domain-containing protein n=1 Tax=unclassified Agarivorans TaxID=2636026 RepID=UPI0010DF4A91|nr:MULTISPECIES: DUF2850 domain-containing protein [unclassified Agarivorans]MDO6684788.1 DUF2850 domain-containing protein [Agarivorans sp. 3_MG-2023]MDO6715051.1 DUF2850 domain-containing protein [Agarivorans sp. 2_MG-2023]GDY28105.1 hypothetical protein AHAT_39950 [Agarivorans sp. Toyoura001]
MKKSLVLIIALFGICLGVLSFVYFTYPELIGVQREVKVNPIVGAWESEHAFYGKKERLVFTDDGQLKSGSRVATKYKINGNKVIVTSTDRVVEYRVSKDGQRLDAYLPRVGRVRYTKVNSSQQNSNQSQ